MKNIATLLVALVLSTGMVFAQSNEYTLEQTGNDNNASATQIGLENEAFIQQGGFGGGSVQSNNATAVIEQVGAHNDARINQRQGWPGGTLPSLHTISQEGQRNEAFLETFNGANDGHIMQLGLDNIAQGRQSSEGGFISISQTGDVNTADADQLQSSGASAVIVQEGSENIAETYQRGGDNAMEIGQYGVSNTARSHQNGAGNLGVIYQEGVNHTGSQWVSGDDNTVIQSQTGERNRQRLEITGSGNTYVAAQDGQRNQAYVNSRGTGPGDNTLSAYNSVMDLHQEGSNLLVSGSMGGDGNTLIIHQAGSDHTISGGMGMYDAAGFTVMGDGNFLQMQQYGDSHNATATVLGDGNTSTVLQIGSN